MEDKRIPVTVLTGFLGSGKTTLLNRILREDHGLRIAVIENEFGEIGIDHELVIGAEEEIFEMNNGCICCTVRGDLIRILGELVKRRKKFDYVLIETTGLADPGPVAQTFFVDEKMARNFRLDGIVTLVDAAHVEQHLDDSSECVEQIAFADMVILNKTDLVETGAIARLEERVRGINAAAKIYRATNADVPIENLLNQRAFELETKLEIAPDFLREEMPFEWAGEYSLETGAHDLHFSPGPDATMQMLALPLPEGETLHDAVERAKAGFENEAQIVHNGETFGPGSLAELQFGEDGGKFVLEIPRAGRYALWTQHGPDEFAMRFTRDGQELQPQNSEEFAGAHSHDDSVSSVGIDVVGNCDPDLLNAWLMDLLQNRGEDIFRMKGVLALEGAKVRFVFQGVHMLFEGQPDRAWEPGEERRNQLIFIGRNLDRAELNEGFRACLSSAAIFSAAAAVR